MTRLSLILTLGLFLPGCGGGPRLTTVTGIVTVQGEPVKMGTITFVPEGTNERASAVLGPDGKFAMSTFQPGDGVLPGSYKIMISAYESLPEMGKPNSGKIAVAAKYLDARTSGLTATIVAGTPQKLEFDLKKP